MTKDSTHDDPPVAHVLYGKHGNGFDAITATPGKPCQHAATAYKDGVVVGYSVHIPAHSTRYLLVFAEMNKNPGDALDSVKKFNDQKLSDKLLKGISGKVQKKIVNWDL